MQRGRWLPVVSWRAHTIRSPGLPRLIATTPGSGHISKGKTTGMSTIASFRTASFEHPAKKITTRMSALRIWSPSAGQLCGNASREQP
jgi:hypothetical protein